MCDFCEIFDFGRAKCDIDKYGASITFAGGSNRFPEYQQFNYCPKCGKSRMEIMLERERKKQHGN